MFINPRVKLIDRSKNESKEKFYCNTCDYPLFSTEDFRTCREYDICHDCYLTFVEARKSDWENGWRPKRKALDNYLKQKKRRYENN